MRISIQLNDYEEKLFKNYAKMHGYSLSAAMREALLEKIEDEYDVAVAESSHREFLKDQRVYTLKEVKKQLKI